MSFKAKSSFSIFVLNVMQDACISVRGGGAGRAAAPPVGKKINIIRAKLMYRSGKDTLNNILLFNILIYLFSSRNSPNPLSDLCTTSRDGCYYSELEH